MSQLDFDKCGAAATALAREAGTYAQAHFRKAISVEHKALGDIVTEVDRTVEQRLRQALVEQFPGTSVLGEEYGGALSDGALWVVDPVDGTTNYAHGYPHWCVSIGLLVDGVPGAGAIYDPVHDELFSAVRGQGAKLNGLPIACSTASGIASSVLCIGLTRSGDLDWTCRQAAALSHEGASVRSQGAGALTLAHVAAGRCEAFFEDGIHLWDVAAASLILTEAGGGLCHRFNPAEPRGGFSLLGAAPGVFPLLREKLGYGEDFKADFG